MAKRYSRKQQQAIHAKDNRKVYLGYRVKDEGAPGLSTVSEVRGIRDNIIKDRKRNNITKKEAASRMNLLKLVASRDSDFQAVKKRTRAKKVVDRGIKDLKEIPA